MANLQMIAQANAFNKVRAVKALAAAATVTAALTEAAATLTGVTAVLTEAQVKIDQLRKDVNSLLP